jgi:hypothetical protein
MIVGESHYLDIPLPPDCTKVVVQAMLDEPWKPWMQFFARTVGVFQGGSTTPELRRQFWSCAVFYNFVQETVGSFPRMRPTAEMW